MKNKIRKTSKNRIKKSNFILMSQPSKKPPKAKKQSKKTKRLKINLTFEEALKVVFEPKSLTNKK